MASAVLSRRDPAMGKPRLSGAFFCVGRTERCANHRYCRPNRSPSTERNGIAACARDCEDVRSRRNPGELDARSFGRTSFPEARCRDLPNRRAGRPTRSTRPRSASCSTQAFCRPFGVLMSRRVACAGCWGGAIGWCARAPGPRTPCTRRSGASSRAARRGRTCSAARDAPGWGGSSCRRTSARSSRAACGRSTSSRRRSRRSSQSSPGWRSRRSRSSG
jgi:hypothetical protein